MGCENIRFISSRSLSSEVCLPAMITARGRPSLSKPCTNTFSFLISFGISDSETKPLGMNSRRHFRYFKNIAVDFSMFKSRALRNLLSIRSSCS